jgi:hypothetical protein
LHLYSEIVSSYTSTTGIDGYIVKIERLNKNK